MLEGRVSSVLVVVVSAGVYMERTGVLEGFVEKGILGSLRCIFPFADAKGGFCFCQQGSSLILQAFRASGGLGSIVILNAINPRLFANRGIVKRVPRP